MKVDLDGQGFFRIFVLNFLKKFILALLKFNCLLLEQKVLSIITLSQLICQTNTIVPCSWIGIPFIVHTVYTQIGPILETIFLAPKL